MAAGNKVASTTVLLQLKKTLEELSDALAAKEEIAQRCHELDMQVRFRHQLLCWLWDVAPSGPCASHYWVLKGPDFPHQVVTLCRVPLLNVQPTQPT